MTDDRMNQRSSKMYQPEAVVSSFVFADFQPAKTLSRPFRLIIHRLVEPRKGAKLRTVGPARRIFGHVAALGPSLIEPLCPEDS